MLKLSFELHLNLTHSSFLRHYQVSSLCRPDVDRKQTSIVDGAIAEFDGSGVKVRFLANSIIV